MQPGNLIRTPDGRLAILDFGLMTQIDDNIKFGMIEVCTAEFVPHWLFCCQLDTV